MAGAPVQSDQFCFGLLFSFPYGWVSSFSYLLISYYFVEDLNYLLPCYHVVS